MKEWGEKRDKKEEKEFANHSVSDIRKVYECSYCPPEPFLWGFVRQISDLLGELQMWWYTSTWRSSLKTSQTSLLTVHLFPQSISFVDSLFSSILEETYVCIYLHNWKSYWRRIWLDINPFLFSNIFNLWIKKWGEIHEKQQDLSSPLSSL